MEAIAQPDAELHWQPRLPVHVRTTLSTLQHGRWDPCQRHTSQGEVWRATRMPSGPATLRIWQRSLHDLSCQAWGPGAKEAVETAPDLLGGERDDAHDFAPRDPLLERTHAHHPGLRIPRTCRVVEALIPAIFEQRVQVRDAQASWRRLVHRHGEAAPGPAPSGLRLPPSTSTLRALASWDWHRLGVDPRRARAAAACLSVAERLEECADLDRLEAAARILAIPGIGSWTLAEVAQRAFGDADALSVGDLHLAPMVGTALTGSRLDDAGMVKLLEPFRPHRFRVVRLLQLGSRWRW